MKICSKCLTEKSLELFYRMKVSKDGRGPWCKICMDKRRTDWTKANPERDRLTKRANEKKNRAHIYEYRKRPDRVAWMRKYSEDWYERNRERLKPIRAAWHQRNYPGLRKELMVQTEANRRARKRAVGGLHTYEEVMALYARQDGKCVACQSSLVDGFHRDHIVPLIAKGTNNISNIQLLCPDCNRTKGPRSMEWLLKRKTKR